MKKISFSIFAILLLCVVTLSGCAKADTASLLDCYNLYNNLTETYSSQDKYLYIGETNKQVDLYSQNAYNQYAYQAIQAEEGNFKLLKYGKQFQVLTSAALSFYDKYDTYLSWQTTNYDEKVSQEQKAKLYRAIDGLYDCCENLTNNKKTFVTMCYKDFSVNNINVLHNLESFVKSYKQFIGKAMDISIAYEDIYVTGMITQTPNSIATSEGQRLVESAKLYIAKYVYLTYIANQSVFYDCSQQPTYAKLLEISNSEAITFSAEPTETEVNTYNFMCDKLQNFKTGIKNYEYALQNQDSNQTYKDYVESFENVVIDFATSVQVNLLKV